MIITFYSYKGGVGRSMALANVATILSIWGFKVLIVDFDLEAPGLQYFFKDYIQDFDKIGNKEGILNLLNRKDPINNLDWKDLIVPISIAVQSENNEFKGARVDLVLSGNKDDPNYTKELKNFDAPEFYKNKKGGKVIEKLRYEWKENYDFVLIDSRTGITDIGGICTIQFPDILVTLFTATEQGWTGTKNVALKAIENQDNLPYDRERLKVLPIPTRIDNSEKILTDEWLDKFSKEVKLLIGNWIHREINIRHFVDKIFIPYVPFYSFGEKLAVIDDTTNPLSIGYSLESISALLANGLVQSELFLSKRDQFIEIVKQKGKLLQKVLEDKEFRLYEANLIIIGESGAGKTTLTRKISEGIEMSMPSEDDTTRGINIVNVNFPIHSPITNKVENFKMNIWDFGGQEIYHSTHQFFLTKRSLYVLVTDGRKQNTYLNYWCQVVELLGENSPMLIVENQKQGHTLTSLNFDAYKSRFEFICSPLLRSNFLTNDGLSTVIEEIKLRIQNLPDIGSVLPITWFNIRHNIEQKAQTKDYISEDEYITICEAEGLSYIDALHLSKDYLHPVGVLLHFQDNPILRNYVILNNAWATDAVYAVLRSDKIVKETQGHFTYQDAEVIWSDAKYRRQVDFLLELMKKFELCYQLENNQKYIAPLLLPSSPPAYTLREGKKVRIIYEYDFLPKGLLNRLTVRLREHIADQHWVWQQGVVLQMEDNQAEVIESYDNRKIEINAVGEEPKEILTEITRQLDKLNRSFEKIRVDKKVPCNCPTCSRSETPYFYSYESLYQRYRKNKPTIECDISYQEVNVLGLLFGILNEVPEINSKKIFFSYSKEDSYLRDELEKHLSSLKPNRRVETWHDRDMLAGDEWHPTIIEKLEAADIVLLLVSANFLATDYIMNEEVPRALERAANKKCMVIPILISPCFWENEPFAKLSALPGKGKAVTQYTDRDEAWTLVAKGIDQIVKGEI